MNDGTRERYNPPRAQRRVLPLAIVAAVVVITVASVAFTVIWGGHRTPTTTATLSSATPSVPPHLPAPAASAPPLGTHFTLQLKPPFVTPTPCPGYVLPASVLGNAATETPTATATTPAVSRDTTATPAPIPLCGNGQLFGPKCYSVLPGTEPTQDQIRQSLFTSAGKYSLSFPLVEAVAWQESGWHELVQACDGGIGVMQIQPETVQWLNATFHTDYSAFDLDGNTNLGTSMVSWLYNYYLPFCNQGLPSGQTCNGDTVWPGATDNATLRDVVISAYNEGPGTMAKYGIQNWNYVHSVLSFLNQFKVSQ